MAFLTWDPATVTAVTLSGGNLIASNTGGTSTDQGARIAPAAGKTSGKYYFEITTTTSTGGGNTGLGICTTASTYINMGNNATTGFEVFASTGNIFSNGSSVGSSIGSLTSGTVVGVAVDLDNHTGWFRKAPSGSWNNSGTANPATNTGGVVIPTGTMVPVCTFNAAGNVYTANFGASAFSGAVPSGFNSGWSDPIVSAIYTKYNDFTEQLHRAKHDFGTHIFKVALTNTAPDIAIHRSLSDIGEIAAGNGYPGGGIATAVGISRAGGTTTITATDTTFTAVGGSIANFRYAVLYNDSMTSPPDGLIVYWDCSATQSLAAGQALVVDFNPIVLTHS